MFTDPGAALPLRLCVCAYLVGRRVGQAPWYAYVVAFLCLAYITLFVAEAVHLWTMGSHLPVVERFLKWVTLVLRGTQRR